VPLCAPEVPYILTWNGTSQPWWKELDCTLEHVTMQWMMCMTFRRFMYMIKYEQERLLEESSFATTFLLVYFIFYILPLHVSALAVHPQAEYAIILGSYFTHNGFIIRTYLLYMFSKY
jgi:hypothetical protein